MINERYRRQRVRVQGAWNSDFAAMLAAIPENKTTLVLRVRFQSGDIAQFARWLETQTTFIEIKFVECSFGHSSLAVVHAALKSADRVLLRNPKWVGFGAEAALDALALAISESSLRWLTLDVPSGWMQRLLPGVKRARKLRRLDIYETRIPDLASLVTPSLRVLQTKSPKKRSRDTSQKCMEFCPSVRKCAYSSTEIVDAAVAALFNSCPRLATHIDDSATTRRPRATANTDNDTLIPLQNACEFFNSACCRNSSVCLRARMAYHCDRVFGGSTMTLLAERMYSKMPDEDLAETARELAETPEFATALLHAIRLDAKRISIAFLRTELVARAEFLQLLLGVYALNDLNLAEHSAFSALAAVRLLRYDMAAADELRAAALAKHIVAKTATDVLRTRVPLDASDARVSAPTATVDERALGESADKRKSSVAYGLKNACEEMFAALHTYRERTEVLRAPAQAEAQTSTAPKAAPENLSEIAAALYPLFANTSVWPASPVRSSRGPVKIRALDGIVELPEICCESLVLNECARAPGEATVELDSMQLRGLAAAVIPADPVELLARFHAAQFLRWPAREVELLWTFLFRHFVEAR